MDNIYYTLRDVIKQKKDSIKMICLNQSTYDSVVNFEAYNINPVLLGYKIVIDNALDDNVAEII